jgi:hypothetical protein
MSTELSQLGWRAGGLAGIFEPSQQRIHGSDPSEAVFLADLDAEGKLDALVTTKSQAAVWWNNGQAGFIYSIQRHGQAMAISTAMALSMS